ncbi:MAG TPA: cell division protein FtsI, partial [Candidatus Blautia avistercoris]|nr:cell division protein FtsI [Candidatus Blautia avistercoris]
AFGQGYTCTMIQEINALCSVINGGYYYQPHVVNKILDSNGSVIKNITPTLLKQTISANISKDIREYMRASVEGGTSRHSKVQGYSSGGKTGTAEKFPRGNGKYLVSFIGFAPVDDPEVVVYVVVDEPNAEDQASSTYAQYIAQGIFYELLPYLNVEPDESSDGTVPETELWEGFSRFINQEEKEEAQGDEDTPDSDSSEDSTQEDTYVDQPEGDYVQDGTSDENVPAPLEEEDTGEQENNDMESQGITNEEAGIE